MIDPLPLALVGWLFTLLSAAALLIGALLILALHRSGELQRRFLAQSAWSDMLLFGIWILGLAGGLGVLALRPWARHILEFFCWTLAALMLLSAGTRLYGARRRPAEERANWVGAVAGATLVALPVLVLCAVTIYTLRSESARQAFGG
ncbi:MAG: hypothetical protein U1F45_06850 [Burkholderiales bacterium]